MLLEVKENKVKGRGLYAKSTIPQGQVILLATANTFITFSLFSDHPCFDLVHKSTNQMAIEFGLLLASVECMPEQEAIYKEVKQYQKSLPKHYHNLIAWSNCQLDLLNNKELVSIIKLRKQKNQAAFCELMFKLKKQLQNIRQKSHVSKVSQTKKIKRGNRSFNGKVDQIDTSLKLKHLEILTSVKYENVIKYVCAVESRNAYFPNEYDDSSTVGALIPELQLLNHSKYSKCIVQRTSQQYRVVAKEQIQKGEEVCVDYGHISIEKFLEYYGMIPLEGNQKSNKLESGKEKSIKSQLSQYEISRQRQELAEQYNREWSGQRNRMSDLKKTVIQHAKR